MEEKETVNASEVVCFRCGTKEAGTVTGGFIPVDRHILGSFSPAIGVRYCAPCYERLYFTCISCCETNFRNEEGEEVCERCIDMEYGSTWPERPYSERSSSKHQSTELGEIIKSTRIFSAELECYAPSSSIYRKALRATNEGIGATQDGSLHSNGVEFQTPKLKGKKGEDVLKELCSVVNTLKFKVDNTCGLHIHLDGHGLLPRTLTKHEPIALKQLWAFYYFFEPVLHSFLPHRRRSNRYCLPLRRHSHLAGVLRAQTLRDLERAWYKEVRVSDIEHHKDHKYDDSRYIGVNFHSLLSAKHLEIRYHSGTLNARKILEWANLHLRILDLAAAHKLEVPTLTGELEADTRLFFDTLGLPASSVKYFYKRQEAFNANAEGEEQVVNDTH